MSKNMYIARSSDETILERGESGGAVTSVLKCALENGDIDGVVTVRSKNGDRFSGLPVLITNPDELLDYYGMSVDDIVNFTALYPTYLDL